jgi:hypothetical protein
MASQSLTAARIRPRWTGGSLGRAMAGYQQQHALAVNEGIFQRSVDRLPGPFEIVPVEIDGPVRLHRSGL